MPDGPQPNTALPILVDQLGVGHVVLDAAGGVRAINAVGRALFAAAADWSAMVPGVALDAVIAAGATGLSAELPGGIPIRLHAQAAAADTVELLVVDQREQHAARRELEAQRSFLRQIIDTDPALIFVKDRQGVFVMVNRATAEIYGTTVEGLEGCTDADFNDDPEQVAFFRTIDAQVMDSGRPLHIDEETVTDAAGNDHILQTVKLPLSGDDGVADQVLGVCTDITRRKELEEQLGQARKMEAIGSLAGGVAHDFNNLLTAIIGNCELLEAELGEDCAASGRVGQILDAAARASALTRQLLAFSRKQVLKPELIDLGEVVRDMEQLLRRLIGEDIALELTAAADSPVVRVDPSQMQQVVMNLAVNAGDAMPDGGRLRIAIGEGDYAGTEIAPGRYALLEVTDTGIGMEAAERDRIFEPFYSTKGPDKGTGLGLSTVYGVVQQSGGAIEVESEPGNGTTFRVYLPAIPRDAGEGPSAPRDPTPYAGSRIGGTILLAEDDPGVREFVAECLRYDGHAVLVAEDGERALELVVGEDIDLLVTDVVMPGMGGIALAEQLLAERPDLRVIFMSGYTTEAIERHGVLTERSCFLEKPLSSYTLLKTVDAVLVERFQA